MGEKNWEMKCGETDTHGELLPEDVHRKPTVYIEHIQFFWQVYAYTYVLFSVEKAK